MRQLRKFNPLPCLVALLALGLAQSSLCYGAGSLKILFTTLSDKDFKELPDYLQDRVMYHNTHNPLYYDKWLPRFGNDFIHYHHFALAIVYLNRARLDADIKERNGLLQHTLGELDYMIKNCSPKHEYIYLFHYYKGETYLYLRDYLKAAGSLSMAIKYKQDYSPAYKLLSFAYSSVGLKDKAKEVDAILNKLGNQRKQ